SVLQEATAMHLGRPNVTRKPTRTIASGSVAGKPGPHAAVWSAEVRILLAEPSDACPTGMKMRLACCQIGAQFRVGQSLRFCETPDMRETATSVNQPIRLISVELPFFGRSSGLSQFIHRIDALDNPRLWPIFFDH